MKRVTRRRMAWAVLVAGLSSGGCYYWAPVPHAALRDGRQDIRLRDVRFSGGAERTELYVHRVSYPTVDGWSWERGHELRLDATRYRTIEARRLDGLGTVGLVLGIPVGAGLAFLGILAILFSGFR